MCFTVTCDDCFCTGCEFNAFDLDDDRVIEVFEYYINELSYEQIDIVLNKLYDMGHFDSMCTEDLLKLYCTNNKKYCFRYIDQHVDHIDQIIECLKHETIFEQVVERYIDKIEINVSSILRTVIDNDFDKLLIFLIEHNILCYSLNELSTERNCTLIFIYLIETSTVDEIKNTDHSFLIRNIKSREFKNYYNKLNFNSFCSLIQKLPDCCIEIITSNTFDFRNVYCKVKLKTSDHDTIDISRTVNLLANKTCTDTFGLIVGFL